MYCRSLDSSEPLDGQVILLADSLLVRHKRNDKPCLTGIGGGNCVNRKMDDEKKPIDSRPDKDDPDRYKYPGYRQEWTRQEPEVKDSNEAPTTVSAAKQDYAKSNKDDTDPEDKYHQVG